MYRNIEQIRGKLTSMLDYHQQNISTLDSITNDELNGQLLSLSTSINRTIIKPIERTLILLTTIEEIGLENIPEEIIDEWLEEIELISTLECFEV